MTLGLMLYMKSLMRVVEQMLRSEDPPSCTHLKMVAVTTRVMALWMI